MTDSDLTVSILREIRDAIVTASTRLDAVNENLSARIDAVNDSLSTRIDTLTERVDLRFSLVENALQEIRAQLLLVTRYLKNRTEVEIDDLRQRVSRLETKVG